MRFLLPALVAGIFAASPAYAIDWPDFAPEPPNPFTMGPGPFLCQTIEQTRALVDDIEDPAIPVPDGCDRLQRPALLAWEVVETYDDDSGEYRYWLVKVNLLNGDAPRFLPWLRADLGKVIGTPI